jgi:mercuric ion binding protein
MTLGLRIAFFEQEKAVKNLLIVATLTILSAVSASASATPKTVTLSVPDMNCPVCPITLKKSIGAVKGVGRIDVNFDRKEVTVTFDDAKTNVDALQKASADAGFPASVKP